MIMSETITSNGWALTAGGIFTILAVVSVFVIALFGPIDPNTHRGVAYAYILVDYSLLFGTCSFIGAFQ